MVRSFFCVKQFVRIHGFGAGQILKMLQLLSFCYRDIAPAPAPELIKKSCSAPAAVPGYADWY